MSSRTRLHLDLLALGGPLRRYARRLDPDVNASFLLVHKALATAFSAPIQAREAGGLEVSLQEDIDRRAAAAAPRAPASRACLECS
ncbi:MAG: hypothetical protein WDM92_00970 [Caulobacteraceae bacterium]